MKIYLFPKKIVACTENKKEENKLYNLAKECGMNIKDVPGVGIVITVASFHLRESLYDFLLEIAEEFDIALF